MYEGKHNHEMPQINKLAKEVSDLSGNINSQAKPDLVLQSLSGNMNILSEFAPAYSVPEKNQEFTVSTQTKRDREEEGHVSEIVYRGVHNHSKHQYRIKREKEGIDLSGNINSQAKPDLGLQSQAGNWSKSSQVVRAYLVPERDQESTQTALTQLTGSRDSEGEGDAETIEAGDEPNPKRRHVPTYYYTYSYFYSFFVI
ncbi:hypothetical protein SO802_000139 [Lithocarpus litseifolius]|uniref:WRKY domain-containing protein n=1 Tax=Lithocarpus litseifolius TaxID=425828 RepID=A0AAW2DUT6_9ROSI